MERYTIFTRLSKNAVDNQTSCEKTRQMLYVPVILMTLVYAYMMHFIVPIN
jgi:hypothetical protein